MCSGEKEAGKPGDRGRTMTKQAALSVTFEPVEPDTYGAGPTPG